MAGVRESTAKDEPFHKDERDVFSGYLKLRVAMDMFYHVQIFEWVSEFIFIAQIKYVRYIVGWMLD